MDKKISETIMAKRILIIEDDEFLRSLLNTRLSSEGFSVSMAIDGKDGLKKIKEEKPDMILLDLLLPIMDGFEVLSVTKSGESTKSIPVIILSNLGQKKDVDRGLKMGAADYIIKSQFTIEEIIDKIKKTV